MALAMSVNSTETPSMGTEYILGLTAGSTRASGSTTKCTAKVYSAGWTEEVMKVNTRKIKSKASENSSGLMEGATKESGKTGSSMGKACLHLLQGLVNTVNGGTASVLGGFQSEYVIITLLSYIIIN